VYRQSADEQIFLNENGHRQSSLPPVSDVPEALSSVARDKTSELEQSTEQSFAQQRVLPEFKPKIAPNIQRSSSTVSDPGQVESADIQYSIQAPSLASMSLLPVLVVTPTKRPSLPCVSDDLDALEQFLESVHSGSMQSLPESSDRDGKSPMPDREVTDALHNLRNLDSSRTTPFNAAIPRRGVSVGATSSRQDHEASKDIPDHPPLLPNGSRGRLSSAPVGEVKDVKSKVSSRAVTVRHVAAHHSVQQQKRAALARVQSTKQSPTADRGHQQTAV
jgi:hypothetical protein